MVIFKLSESNKNAILDCLCEGKRHNKESIQRINTYFKNGWIVYGFGNTLDVLIAYCFVKNPTTRPETTTVVHSKYRNRGIATELRNEVLKMREFTGHIVYSSVKLDNPASFKSILKSGYSVFDVTKDGYVQLMKILPYK